MELPRRNTAKRQRGILLIENSSRPVSTIAGLTLATTASLLIPSITFEYVGVAGRRSCTAPSTNFKIRRVPAKRHEAGVISGEER